jgi:protein TonB
MKTIEKASNAAVYAENLEDIIFDGRNQKYGAYSLRKNYNNHLLLSLLTVIFIAALATGIPFFRALLNPPVPKPAKVKTVIFIPDYVTFATVLPPPPIKTTRSVPTSNIASTLAPKVVEELAPEDDIIPQEEPLRQIGPSEIPAIMPFEPIPPKPEVVTDPNPTYNPVQVTEQASFMGGPVDNFRIWLAKNIYYPLDALENEIKGTVFLKFAIDKLGKICDITVLRGIDPIIDQAAIDALKKSPKWAAATIDGKAVKVSYCIPVAFDIQK